MRTLKRIFSSLVFITPILLLLLQGCKRTGGSEGSGDDQGQQAAAYSKYMVQEFGLGELGAKDSITTMAATDGYVWVGMSSSSIENLLFKQKHGAFLKFSKPLPEADWQKYNKITVRQMVVYGTSLYLWIVGEAASEKKQILMTVSDNVTDGDVGRIPLTSDIDGMTVVKGRAQLHFLAYMLKENGKTKVFVAQFGSDPKELAGEDGGEIKLTAEARSLITLGDSLLLVCADGSYLAWNGATLPEELKASARGKLLPEKYAMLKVNEAFGNGEIAYLNVDGAGRFIFALKEGAESVVIPWQDFNTPSFSAQGKETLIVGNNQFIIMDALTKGPLLSSNYMNDHICPNASPDALCFEGNAMPQDFSKGCLNKAGDVFLADDNFNVNKIYKFTKTSSKASAQNNP